MGRSLGLVFIIWGFLSGSLGAQSKSLVHFNQPFYVTGEVIWYKLYLPPNSPEGPRVITVSLLDKEGTLIDQSFLRGHREASLSGFYRVPFSWRSGVYRLVFSASRRRTQESLLLAEARLPIYSDLEEELPNIKGPSAIISQKPNCSELQVKIEAGENDPALGDTADFRIKVLDGKGQPVAAKVSIAVRDQELFSTEQAGFSTLQVGNEIIDTSQWEKNISIRGRLINPESGEVLPGGNIAAYLLNTYQFRYAKADKEGQFILDLPDLYGPIPLHMIGFFPEDIRVDLDLAPPVGNKSESSLVFPAQVRQYLELSRKRKLIYQLYGRLEQEVLGTFTGENYNKPVADSPVLLDEYDAFTDFATMVRDLSIPIRFREWEGQRLGARIFDPSQPLRSYYSDQPLFIVDGMLTRDDHFIANLDITKVERFDLFYAFDRLLRLYGPIARHGLVRIESRNRNIEVPKKDQKNFFRLQGFQPRVSYPIAASLSEEKPVQLRPSLFWQPEGQTDSQGELKINIPLSDDQSHFVIEVVVQDAEGRRGCGEHVFFVAQNQK